MQYSRANIVAQHLEFCNQHNITVTQEQRNVWSQMPVKYLKRALARDRLEIAKGQSQHATLTFE